MLGRKGQGCLSLMFLYQMMNSYYPCKKKLVKTSDHTFACGPDISTSGACCCSWFFYLLIHLKESTQMHKKTQSYTDPRRAPQAAQSVWHSPPNVREMSCVHTSQQAPAKAAGSSCTDGPSAGPRLLDLTISVSATANRFHKSPNWLGSEREREKVNPLSHVAASTTVTHHLWEILPSSLY